jgi:1,2-diacylglycerol 3-alpha-glucosyltransferase
MTSNPDHRTHAAAETPFSRPQVAVFFYRLGPYHHARLKAAGSQLHVTAVEFSNVDPMYAWDLVEGSDGFDRVTLFSGMPVNELPTSRIFNRVSEALDQLRPQVVAIPGWSDPCSLAVLRWCQTHTVPAVMMSETTAWDDTRKWWKEGLKRRIVKLCRAGLVGGRAHAAYLAQLGMAPEKIFFGYDVVDNEHFAAGAATARSEEQAVRRKCGLPENYFLASARFIEKKNLSRLIEAYALYRKQPSPQGGEENVPWDLVLLGDGPLKPALSSRIAALDVQKHVHLPGFKQYDELPLYYGLANVFIHASTTEPWGLVVNEAMASGLPVLVSNRCGCAMDLVQEGVNGYTFDPLNVEQLASLMSQLSTFNFQLSTFSAASRKIISSWGTERFADGLRRAVESALVVRPGSASAFDRLVLASLGRRQFSYE